MNSHILEIGKIYFITFYNPIKAEYNPLVGEHGLFYGDEYFDYFYVLDNDILLNNRGCLRIVDLNKNSIKQIDTWVERNDMFDFYIKDALAEYTKYKKHKDFNEQLDEILKNE